MPHSMTLQRSAAASTNFTHNLIPTRCHAMMHAMQDIAASKGNVDFADL
ncbi:hypothetical protein [Bartonella sp. HY038]|nr:hypothetical protein [Bartonella sp. HY038]